MTEVACFCGCCFSFDGSAAACPRCGAVAAVTAGLALEGAGRSQPKIPVPVVNGIGQNEQMAETHPERAEAGALSGRPAGAGPRSLATSTTPAPGHGRAAPLVLGRGCPHRKRCELAG
jgi:hypothetical protein